MAQGDRTVHQTDCSLIRCGCCRRGRLQLGRSIQDDGSQPSNLTLLQNASGGDADALATIADQFGTTGAGMLARIYEADTK